NSAAMAAKIVDALHLDIKKPKQYENKFEEIKDTVTTWVKSTIRTLRNYAEYGRYIPATPYELALEDVEKNSPFLRGRILTLSLSRIARVTQRRRRQLPIRQPRSSSSKVPRRIAASRRAPASSSKSRLKRAAMRSSKHGPRYSRTRTRAE